MSVFTCVLSCSANGEKLKPLIIFKRKTVPKENFPPGVVIRVNEKGWMCEEVMLAWIEEVWRKRRGAFFKPCGLLIMDSMRAHLLESVKIASGKAGATLAVIPGGLTKKLQPLDITVNKCFKSEMRRMWEEWMSEGLHSYTKTGKMRRATYSDVAGWVDASWKSIKNTTVVSGFTEAGIIRKDDDVPDILDDVSDVDDPPVPELEEDFLQLFNSESEDSDFEGFE